MSAGYYDGGRVPKLDHDPSQEIQWEVQHAAKKTGAAVKIAIARIVEASRKALEEAFQNEIKKIVAQFTSMFGDIQKQIENSQKQSQDLIAAIWNGFGMPGKIQDIFDPNYVHVTMEIINGLIADLQAQVNASSGGVVEQFLNYPNGQSLGNKWALSYPSGFGGNFGIAKGLAKFVTPVGLDGRRARFRYLPSSPKTDNHRVDMVFTTSPGVGNLVGNAWNEIHARVNPSADERVFMRLYGDKCQVGYDLPSGRRVIDTVPLNFRPTSGYGILCRDWTFELWEGNRLVFSREDMEKRSARGPNNRSIGGEVWAPNGMVNPAPLAAIGYRDV